MNSIIYDDIFGGGLAIGVSVLAIGRDDTLLGVDEWFAMIPIGYLGTDSLPGPRIAGTGRSRGIPRRKEEADESDDDEKRHFDIVSWSGSTLSFDLSAVFE